MGRESNGDLRNYWVRPDEPQSAQSSQPPRPSPTFPLQSANKPPSRTAAPPAFADGQDRRRHGQDQGVDDGAGVDDPVAEDRIVGGRQQRHRADRDPDTEAPFDPARAELASALARIGWRNASIILRPIDDDVLGATGRPEFRNICRQTAGTKAMLRSLVGFDEGRCGSRGPHRQIPRRADGRREAPQPVNASNVSLEVSIAWPLNEVEKSPSWYWAWSFLTRMSPSTLLKPLSMPLTILST